MSIRNTTATLLVSTLLLAAGTGIAAAQQTGADQSFASQISETADALNGTLPGSMGRSERLTAEHHLQVARDLYRQGQTATAQSFLNFARGELGLATTRSAAEVSALPSLYTSNDAVGSIH